MDRFHKDFCKNTNTLFQRVGGHVCYANNSNRISEHYFTSGIEHV